MKKTRLLVDFEYDFDLFGITSSTKFYKLCWAINNKLGVNLTRQEDFELLTSGNQKALFINYHYQDDSCEFDLFKNKSPDNESSYMLPELIHYDYVLKYVGTFQTFAIEEVLKQLREVKYIEYLAQISIEKLKSKDNFLK